MTAPTWSNERRRLSALIPWPRNPRQIKGESVRRLQESFEEFGQPEVIAISQSGEVYNGHQRLKSWFAKFGDIEVDVRVSSRPLTEKERERLTVLLHRGAVGEWDFETLANEFEVGELLEWGFTEMELGLDAPAGNADAEPQVDRAEELRLKWGVEPGQLWRVGEHRLVCGDCTDASVVERVMGGERADCTVTDPPYGVGVDYGTFQDTPENVKTLIGKFMTMIPQPVALTPGIPAMWQYPAPAWVGAWVHPAATSSGPWGFVGANPILYYGKDPYLATGKGRRDSSVVMVADRKGEDDHPVSKPLNVWAWLIERMTPNNNEIVYDPFLGSGTTMVACNNLGRRCRGIEIAPNYCAVALQRMEDAFPGILIERVGADG